jgi:hypothetical protein
LGIELTDLRRFVLWWLGVVGIICIALIPIRVYALNANDWLVYLLLGLGVVFLGAFFALRKTWKPKGAAPRSSPSS